MDNTISPATLNTIAIRYLYKRNYDNAIRALRQALVVVRNVTQSNGNNTTQTSELVFDQDYRTVELKFDNDETQSIDSLYFTQGHDCLLAFYNHVFVFAEHVNYNNDVAVATMLLYNLASVIYHQGITTNDSSRIRYALHFYRMGLSPLVGSAVDSSTLLLIHAVSCNNMGHACAALHLMPEYKWCVDQLRSRRPRLSACCNMVPLDEIMYSLLIIDALVSTELCVFAAGA